MDGTYQLVSVHEKRKANMILPISDTTLYLIGRTYYPNIAYSSALLLHHDFGGKDVRRFWLDNNYKPIS